MRCEIPASAHVHERDHDPLRRSALGGLGLLLPSSSRIKPGLTVLAALGCAVLMGAAILFHLSRGEAASTPFNVLLAALALFVAWGRRSKAPIAPRA